MAQLLFQNTGASAIEVADLGIYLLPSEELDLLINFRDEDILESTDIQAAMSGDGEVWLDGTTQLSYQDLIDYLTKLTKYDTIDFSYVSSEDASTDVSGAELEQLTDGSDSSLHTHDSRYYTKTQLQSSGSSTVHWDNITNIPQFGSLNWKDPVDRTDSSYSSGTVLPTSGNELNDARMVADDGDGKPAQYVCIATSGTWEQQWQKIADVDWGSANSIHVNPTGNLSADDVQEALVELQGDIDGIISGSVDITHSLDDAYNDGSTITVDTTPVQWNLNDSQYVSWNADSGATSIVKITAAGAGDSVEINGIVDINASTFEVDATSSSHIVVDGNNLNIQTTTSGNISLNSVGNLSFNDQYLSGSIALSESGVTGLDPSFNATSIIGAINESLSLGSGSDTLDEVYDGPSNGGSGREITVDSGSVKLDATSSTYAPLELTQQSAAPTSGLDAGQLSFVNGELYAYDGTRSKWLSVSSTHYEWSDNAAKGKILRIGSALGSSVGYKVPNNATVVSVTVSSNGSSTRAMELRKNSTATALKSFSLSSGQYSSTSDDIDLAAGDVLQVYVSGGSGSPVKDPVVSVYIKWRV